MTANGWIQIAIYAIAVTICVKPLGLYMAKVFEGERTFLTPVLRPVERIVYAVCGVKAGEEQHWTTYTVGMLLFSLFSFGFLYALQRLQAFLPFNPQHMAAVSSDSSFNTAVSFMSNTNWQGYGGETTMSYLTQMAGLAVQNFVSASVGIVLAIALIRAFARRSMQTVGNFWVDLTRCVLYVALPLSVVVALVLIWQGVPQNLDAYTTAHTLEGARQVIAQGPAASQIAIKQLGTNGGGFFNANSSVPFENPNAITNFIEMWAILVISAALTYTFGASHPGRVVTQTHLLRDIWGPSHVEDTHYLRIVVGKIRQKFHDDAGEPGYRFTGTPANRP
jgi:K+-transporting ATPase ATPase A chain